MTIRYLILSLTHRCNLNCSYCYLGDPASMSDMSEETIRRAISLAAGGGSSFHLQLTGGELTLVPNLIEKAARQARDTGFCHSIGIQTNGTGLTSVILDLIQSHEIQVGVSLDGPPAIHQQQRGMAAETFRGLQRLEDAGIPFRITTVVTQNNVLALDQLVLILARFSCARGIGLDLLVNKGRAEVGNEVSPPNPQALETGLKNMCTVLQKMNLRRRIPLRFREKDLIRQTHGKKNVFCHACRAESLAVDPEGRLFPCGQTMGDPYFAAGTVREPKFENLKVLKATRPRDAACENCEIEAICPGDCPSRLYYNRHDNPGLVCTLYRTVCGR